MAKITKQTPTKKLPQPPAKSAGGRKSAPKAAGPIKPQTGAGVVSAPRDVRVRSFKEADGSLSWNPVDFLDDLCKCIREGFPWDLAAIGAGLTPADLHSWFQRGHAGEEPFATVCLELQKARTECIREYLQSIRIASKDPKHWQAAKWWLETQERDFFGPAATLTITDPTKPPDEAGEEVDPVERSAAVLEVLLTHGVFKPGTHSAVDAEDE